MKEKIIQSIQDAKLSIEQLLSHKNLLLLERMSYAIAETFASGHKLLLAGNGGSLCDAAHFAEELVGIFRAPRRALPAIVLSEPGYLSCVGNDLGFAEIFARGIEAYGKKGDLFLGLSTSGNSANLISAFSRAHTLDLKTIAFLGRGGGALRGVAQLELSIEGFSTSDRIQEAHMTALHILVEMVEEILFKSNARAPRSSVEYAHTVGVE